VRRAACGVRRGEKRNGRLEGGRVLVLSSEALAYCITKSTRSSTGKFELLSVAIAV